MTSTPRPLLRLAHAVAGLVLLGLTGACSDDDGEGKGGGEVSTDSIPRDAAAEEFCEAMTAVQEAEGFEDSQEQWEEMVEVGTPEDMSDDARDGFEVLVEISQESADKEEAEGRVDDLDKGDEAIVTAFLEYYATTCGS